MWGRTWQWLLALLVGLQGLGELVAGPFGMPPSVCDLSDKDEPCHTAASSSSGHRPGTIVPSPNSAHHPGHAVASSTSGHRPSEQFQLVPVSGLSDDDSPAPESQIVTRSLKTKRADLSSDKIRMNVVRACRGFCRCNRKRNDKRNCIGGFAQKMHELGSLQMRLRNLRKLDMDHEAEINF